MFCGYIVLVSSNSWNMSYLNRITSSKYFHYWITLNLDLLCLNICRNTVVRQKTDEMEELDEEQRAILRAKRREARKEMERERRKAVKAAYKRMRDSKKKPDDVSGFVLFLVYCLLPISLLVLESIGNTTQIKQTGIMMIWRRNRGYEIVAEH